MFDVNDLVTAVTSEVITCILSVALGVFVERTSAIIERNRLRDAYKNDKNRSDQFEV